MLASIQQDVKYAFRSFRARPALFGVIALVFALGIGANTVIFSVVNCVVLRPLPYPNVDRLISTYQTIPDWLESDNPSLRAAWDDLGLSYPVYQDWLEQNTVFDALGIYSYTSYVIAEGDRPERLRATRATYGVFDALGVQPMLGRVFLPEDDLFGSENLVILGHGIWQRRFGADSSVIGRILVLDEQGYTIVGVMPNGFHFPNNGELWTTLSDRDRSRTRYNQFARGIATLAPGVSQERAQAEMEVLMNRLNEANPRTDGRVYGVRLISRMEDVIGQTRPALLLLLGAVGVVLIIACANSANLLLVRASERRGELAVRMSLGASRRRLLMQLLTESILLSAVGGAVGLIIAIVGIGPFVALLPSNTPRLTEIEIDTGVLAFAAAISVINGILVGAFPAFAALRTRLNSVLNDSSRSVSAGRYRNRLQAGLLVSEIALTFVLLVGAALLTKSFVRLLSVERGFVAESVVRMRIDLRGSRYSSEDQIEATHRELSERLLSIPGVTGVATSTGRVFGSVSSGWTAVETSRGFVETNTQHDAVSPSFFQVLGIPLVAGRTFTDDDAENGQVALISRSMAETFWPHESAIGRRVKQNRIGGDSPWLTVVGVVGDVRRELDTEPYAVLYQPVRGHRATVLIRVAVPPPTIIAAAREEMRAVDPSVPIVELATLSEAISSSVVGPRVRTILMGALAGLAATLAVVGIFGVLAYSVAQRTNEIGIRMALGAGSGKVLRNVMTRGLLLLVIGLSVGFVATLVVVRALEDFLYKVSPTDPLTLLAVTALLSAAAMAASFLPARRAAKVDPAVALRHE